MPLMIKQMMNFIKHPSGSNYFTLRIENGR